MYELGLIILAGCVMSMVRGTFAITRLIVVTCGNLAVERERGRTLLALAAAGALRSATVHHGPDTAAESTGARQ